MSGALRILHTGARQQLGRRSNISGRATALVALSISTILAAGITATPAHATPATLVTVPSHAHSYRQAAGNIGGSFDTDQIDPTWAGYIESPKPYALDYVTTDFIVPAITCPSAGETDLSIWAGIGSGNTDSDPLFQTGIAFECNNGTLSTMVFYEEWAPGSSYQTGRLTYAHNHTVSPGDKMVAQVGPGPNSVSFLVQDYGSNLSQLYPNWTDSTSYSTTLGNNPTQEECIAEDPSVNGAPGLLADFGTINFSTDTSGSFAKACDVTANDRDNIISSDTPSLNGLLNDSSYDNIYDVTTNSVLAQTSDFSGSGAFTETWQGSGS